MVYYGFKLQCCYDIKSKTSIFVPIGNGVLPLTVCKKTDDSCYLLYNKLKSLVCHDWKNPATTFAPAVTFRFYF